MENDESMHWMLASMSKRQGRIPLISAWSVALTFDIILAVMVLMVQTDAAGASAPNHSKTKSLCLIRPGAPVRLTALGEVKRSIRGVFLRANQDSVYIRDMPQWGIAQDIGLNLKDVTRIDVSRERGPRTWAGVGLGGLGGALIAMVLCGTEEEDQLACFLLIAPFGSGLGMMVGSLIGSAIEGDRWQTVFEKPPPEKPYGN